MGLLRGVVGLGEGVGGGGLGVEFCYVVGGFVGVVGVEGVG